MIREEREISVPFEEFLLGKRKLQTIGRPKETSEPWKILLGMWQICEESSWNAKIMKLQRYGYTLMANSMTEQRETSNEFLSGTARKDSTTIMRNTKIVSTSSRTSEVH